MNNLQIFLLGSCQISRARHEVIAFPIRKELALLVWLAIEQERSHSREQLATLFWPEESPEIGRNNLRVILSRMQKRLGASLSAQPYLLIDRHTLQFNPASVHTLDVIEFQRLLAKTQRHTHDARANCPTCLALLEQAVALYRGDFLSGFYVDDCAGFEEWVTITREQLLRMATESLSDLIEGLERHKLASDTPATILRYAQRWVVLEPLNERAHRQLMRLLVRSGERNAAIAHFHALRQLLHQELGLEPEAESIALLEQIQAGNRQSQKTASPPFSTPPSSYLPIPTSPLPPHNLPVHLTPFIGRESEVAQLLKRLTEPRYRLLSLIGGGGVGKTRLALEIAAHHLHLFADGVFFVPLVAVTQAAAVPSAILSAMQRTLKTEKQSTYEQMLDILRQKRLLLILDNLEHLLQPSVREGEDGEAPTIIDLLVDILHSAPGVILLVTSRERLDLQAEDVYWLGGLPVPPNKKGSQPSTSLVNGNLHEEIDASADFAAIQLFVERAQRLDKTFALTPSNLPAVVSICQWVDGVPLAIELAVTWLDRFSCAEIASQLAQSLHLLQTTQRDVRAQHRSMSVVFATSWSLLTVEEQWLFAQLSIFSGSFTLEAARIIAGATPRLLAQLRHKSMVRSEEVERYQLHELLRQFASEMLHAHYDTAAITTLADRQSDFYLQMMDNQSEAIERADSQSVSAAITAEIDNVRSAWRWAVGQARIPQIDAASAGLTNYYSLMGLAEEGEQAFCSAIFMLRSQDQSAIITRQTLARLLAFYSQFLAERSKFEEAISIAQESLAMAIEIGDPQSEALANERLAFTLAKTNRFALARPYYEQACLLAEQLQNYALLVGALNIRAWVTHSEMDFPTAQSNYERALQICRQQYLRRDEGDILVHLGQFYSSLGDLTQAQRCFEESLALARQLGLRQMEGRTLEKQGTIYDRLGDFSQATVCYQAALQIAQEYGDRWHVGFIYCNLGVSADYSGNYQQALCYMQQSIQVHQQINLISHLHVSEMNLSLIYHHLQDNLSAEHYGRLAVTSAQRIGDRQFEGYAWTIWGHALSELGRLVEATNTYQQALTLHQESGSINLMPEPWAGLARLALAQNNVAKACAWVEEILCYLESSALDSAEEPGRVYLTCYQVLRQAGDPRATAILQRAYTSMQERANKIVDEATRHSFLQNVVAHREIVKEFESREGTLQ